jgi:hypothetical protein
MTWRIRQAYWKKSKVDDSYERWSVVEKDLPWYHIALRRLVNVCFATRGKGLSRMDFVAESRVAEVRKTEEPSTQEF